MFNSHDLNLTWTADSIGFIWQRTSTIFLLIKGEKKTCLIKTLFKHLFSLYNFVKASLTAKKMQHIQTSFLYSPLQALMTKQI